MDGQTPKAKTRLKLFVIRPWHNSKTSLYPPIMDGVEYVDAVIKTIKIALSEDEFDIRVDEDVFIPGQTIRENLERELTNADIVFAILDGLRPNVVYELGFAYGNRRVDTPKRIICLADKDATVLVRNYYPDPAAIPTIHGEKVTILNPPLNMSNALSDNSDLLILIYNRLYLVDTLGAQLKKLAEDMRRQESKQGTASEATKDSATDFAPQSTDRIQDDTSPDVISVKRLWNLYGNTEYDEVVKSVPSPSSFEEKKVLALSLMKLGRIYEAIHLWRDITEADESRGGTLFHLGVCHYVINEFEAAAYYFNEAYKLSYNPELVQYWLKRTSSKISQRTESLPFKCSDPVEGTPIEE